MFTRRWLAGVLIGLLTANTLAAQTVKLAEAPLPDRCVRNELTLEFDGKISVKQDDKDLTHLYKATARHAFTERYLDGKDGIVDRAARRYETALRTSTFDNDESSTIKLRQSRRFMAAFRVRGLVVSYSPDGRLTRDEADLTEHFDTLAIAGLVPGEQVTVGNSWKVANPVIASICGLDGLTEQNVEGTLTAVKDGIAQATLVGKVAGIDKGAQVTLLVNAKVDFDVNAQCITAVEWKQTETRQQGPISPKIDAEVVIRLKREPIEQPADLANAAIVPIAANKTPPADRANIDHGDGQGRYKLQYGRDWHVTSADNRDQLVMRLMERGEFIAQVTVTYWKREDLKKVIALEAFAKLMADSPTWQEEKQQEAKELQDTPKNHHAVYRVVASGELDGVKAWQYFYLIVGQQGDQCIVTFTVGPQHVQRLGSRDLDLVRELVLPE